MIYYILYFLNFNHFYFVASVLMINLSKWYLILLFPISSLAICGLIPPNTIGKVQNSISSHAKYSNYFKFPSLPRPIVPKLSQKYQWAKILLPLKPILRCPKSSNPNLSIATTEGSDHIPPAGKRCLLGVSRVS